MTLHLYMNHKCSECKTEYIPYNNEITCPKCGYHVEMENYPELIDGICESFLYNLKAYKSFVPGAWVTLDVSDTLQMFLFSVFEKWFLKESTNHEPQERTKAFKEFLNDIMEKVDFQKQDYMSNYIRDLALIVYNEFFNIRGINLEITSKGKIKISKDNDE